MKPPLGQMEPGRVVSRNLVVTCQLNTIETQVSLNITLLSTTEAHGEEAAFEIRRMGMTPAK